jgi:hypothetical protein
LTIPLADQSSAGFAADMGESWDTTTKQSFGTSDSSTNTSTSTVSMQTQWSIPANPDLRPGNGATCASATDCSSLAQVPDVRAIEPFWGDTFVFQVHPQFAAWLLDADKTRFVQIAAVPVVATATVAQLAACWLGTTEWPGKPACDLQYSQAILQSANGSAVSYAGSQDHVTLTAEEAHRFLLLDPFFLNGQNANIPADRAINLLSVQYGAMIGQRPRPVSETLTRTLAQTTDKSGSSSTTLSVTSVRGTDSTFNVAESFFGVLGISGTVSSGAKLSNAADMKATFSSSTAVTITNATLAQVALNDQDTTSGCSLPHCHLPLPSRPSVNIFLDKQFGGFMFQDPSAPSGMGSEALSPLVLKSRMELAVAAIKDGYLQAAKPMLKFSDLRPGRNLNDITPAKRRVDTRRLTPH